MGLLSIYLRSEQDYFNEYLKPLPWIKEEVIPLKWEQSGGILLLKAGAGDALQMQFEFDLDAFQEVTQSNLSEDVLREKYISFQKFNEALRANPEHTRFSEWWQQVAASRVETDSHRRLFQFDFTEGPWEIPWELLIGILKFDQLRHHTAIVRCIGQPRQNCQSIFTDSLRILIIKAEATDLNLKQEVENIKNIWNGLEYTVKRAVAEPRVIRAERECIIGELRVFKPHVVWFLGHGAFDNQTYLVFSDQVSVTADEFAGYFDQAGWIPKFAVFWACETLKGNTYRHTEKPDLFRALTRIGIGTMVGMQSSISDDAAIVMSSQLFHGILNGLPFEWAVARARNWLYNSWYKRGDQIATMDWAAPVVWMVERPVAQLNWDISELDQLQLQLLGSVSIGQGLPDAALDVEPPGNDDISRATSWLPYAITVVRGYPDSAEHKLWFLRTLKGIQSISRQAVLVISPVKSGTFRQKFQLWAQGFLGSLEKGKLPDDFFYAVNVLSNDAEAGWRRLCALESIFLAVIDPPPAGEEWFWRPFFHNPKHRAVLTQREIPDQYQQMQINYVKAGEEVSLARIDHAIQQHLLLLTTLALLNIPVRIILLKGMDIVWDPDHLINNWPDLFVKCLGGYVIRAEVREHVLDLADNSTTSQARHNCLLLTKRLIRAEAGSLREFRIQLLLEEGDDDLALVELSTLWHLYMSIHDEVGLFRVAMDSFKLRDYLGIWDWLERARIFLQFGLPNQAQFWLRKEPDNPIDMPYWLSLKAELKKMEGDIRQAHGLVDKALSLCRENQTNPALSDEEKRIVERDYFHYRHDRARLLHFDDNDYTEAVNEYKAIIEEITGAGARGRDEYAHLLAVTHRNLGECILDLGGSPEDVFREADSHLQTALTIEGSLNPFSNLISESYYQLARLELKRTQMEQARQYLQMSITAALVNHFGVMSAIAQNRLMWLDVKERKLSREALGQRWHLVSNNLRGFTANSWAGRTLINANINMVAIVMNETQMQKGREMLEENLDLIRSNQFLRRKGDLRRIVKTLAGLQIYEDAQSGQRDFWGLMKNEFRDAGNYAAEMAWSTPQEAWQGGI